MAPEDAPRSRLPSTYQRVLAWLDEGRSAEEIATDLGIDSGAVPALIELATAKLARAADPCSREMKRVSREQPRSET